MTTMLLAGVRGARNMQRIDEKQCTLYSVTIYTHNSSTREQKTKVIEQNSDVSSYFSKLGDATLYYKHFITPYNT